MVICRLVKVVPSEYYFYLALGKENREMNTHCSYIPIFFFLPFLHPFFSLFFVRVLYIFSLFARWKAETWCYYCDSAPLLLHRRVISVAVFLFNLVLVFRFHLLELCFYAGYGWAFVFAYVCRNAWKISSSNFICIYSCWRECIALQLPDEAPRCRMMYQL